MARQLGISGNQSPEREREILASRESREISLFPVGSAPGQLLYSFEICSATRHNVECR